MAGVAGMAGMAGNISAELRVCDKFNSECIMRNSELSELRWQLYNCL